MEFQTVEEAARYVRRESFIEGGSRRRIQIVQHQAYTPGIWELPLQQVLNTQRPVLLRASIRHEDRPPATQVAQT
jgi:hypothetical protein